MTRTRKWSMLTALVALLVLLAGWFLLVSPKRASADDLRSQAASQQSTNAGLTTKLEQLKQQQKGVPAEEAKIVDIQQRIPQNPALPALIRSLNTVAASSGVLLHSLAPTAPTPSAATSRANAVGANGSTLQVITLNMEVDGSYFNIERFLGKVESLKRALLVTGLTLNVGTASSTTASATTTAAGTSPSLVAVLTVRAFMISSATAPGGSPVHAAAPTTTGAAGAPASASTTPAQ